jgi:hypothetical protein
VWLEGLGKLEEGEEEEEEEHSLYQDSNLRPSDL